MSFAGGFSKPARFAQEPKDGDMDISSINNLITGVTAHIEPASPHLDIESRRTLVQAVKAVNASGLLGENSELTFFIDRNSRNAVVRIVNRQTREVLQQIPDEYVLRLADEVKGS
jgi:hypothetical protein